MDEILKMVSDFGLPPIIGQILAFFFVIVAWQTKLAPYIDKLIYKRKLTRQSSVDSDVKEKLAEAKDLLICDRISIYEFHNSNHNLCGKSFMKYTCTYESCRLGVPGFNILRRDLPISTHKEVIDLIIKNDEIISTPENQDTLSSEFRNYLKDSKAKYSILVPISNRGLLVGMLLVEFIRNIKLTESDIDDIINKSYILVGQIGGKIEYGR